MKNLIQFDEMSTERHRELSARGGRASGETRRRKAAMRASLRDTLEKYAIAEELIDDIHEFHRWQKAKAKRERASRKPPPELVTQFCAAKKGKSPAVKQGHDAII